MNIEREFELAVIIGRFQPLHNGHEELLFKALENANKVLVLVGSSNKPRSLKNPFTYEERKGLLLSFCEANDVDSDRLIIEPLLDFDYRDHLWVQHTWDTLTRVQDTLNLHYSEICIMSSNKDNDADIRKSALYDDRMGYINMEPRSGLYSNTLSATAVREYWLVADIDHLEMMIPEYTFKFLYSKLDVMVKLQREQRSISEAKRPWGNAPYVPIFQTADVCVINQKKEVLLIQRGVGTFGEGQWALVGGYVEANETILEAAVREFKEEAGVDLNKVGYKYASASTYDEVDRDPRGRFITTVYFIEPLEDIEVVAGDDACDYKWVPIDQLKGEEMFLDHYRIIQEYWDGY